MASLRNREWKETDSELEWDIIWAERDWISEVFDHVHLAPHQKVNHFRNHYEVKSAISDGGERFLEFSGALSGFLIPIKRLGLILLTFWD